MGLASVAVVRSPATFSGQPMSFVNDRLCRFCSPYKRGSSFPHGADRTSHGIRANVFGVAI